MAILFFDGFDSFDPANPLQHWDVANVGGTIAIDATGGRRSSPGLTNTIQSAVLRKGFASADSIYAGVAYKPPLVPTDFGTILEFNFDGVPQVHIRAETDGTITARRGHNGTVLGTTAVLLTPGDYDYVECRVVIDNSVGVVELRVNEVTVLNITGADTQQTTSSLVNLVGIGGQADGGVGATLDDFYILDDTGPSPANTFLGDIQVDALRPTADGALSAIPTVFPASPVTQFDKIDETFPDDETTYLESTSTAQISTFVYEDLPALVGAAVIALSIKSRVRKTTSGGQTVNAIVRSGGVNRVLGTLSASDEYLTMQTVNPTDPATAADWLDTNIDAAEFGLEVV